MRVMLVIASICRGGAERVLSIIANHLAAEGHQVTLVTLAGRQLDEYQLYIEVNRIALDTAANSRNLMCGLVNNLWRIKRLREVMKRIRPDVVVSFVTHTNLISLLAILGTGIPVIVSERTDPSQIDIGRFRRVLKKMLYPHASAVVVQTATIERKLLEEIPAARIYVIPNPVPHMDPDDSSHHISLRSLIKIPSAAEIISAMGRLDKGKGFDLLIKAFARIHPRHPNWHLVIFGEGIERINLEQLIAKFAMAEYIHLPGPVRSARLYLAQTDIFVLSSRFEGFPNVLLEAMACGLPVVSFDCPSGPSEIIRTGVDGLLVPCEDGTALENSMSELIMDPITRQRLGMNAREVVQRFSVAQIMKLWSQLLDMSIA